MPLLSMMGILSVNLRWWVLLIEPFIGGELGKRGYPMYSKAQKCCLLVMGIFILLSQIVPLVAFKSTQSLVPWCGDTILYNLVHTFPQASTLTRLSGVHVVSCQFCSLFWHPCSGSSFCLASSWGSLVSFLAKHYWQWILVICLWLNSKFHEQRVCIDCACHFPECLLNLLVWIDICQITSWINPLRFPYSFY